MPNHALRDFADFFYDLMLSGCRIDTPENRSKGI